ncbi:MAG: glycosyltransferase family 4 protein [Methanobacteriaceae archaeon]|nr:glycosyltransferase family 4 protein [Methanobacteriaceae archaeon]
MKIAMVGQYPPHIGGVAAHMNSLAKELVKKGHEVYVITYPHNDLKKGEIKDIDGVHVIGTSGVNIPGLRGAMFERNAEKALKKLVKEEKIDIIHGHYLFPPGLVSVNVGEKTNTKTYVTAHGSDMFRVYAKSKSMKSAIKKVLKKADVVLAVSNALKDEIISTDIEGISEKTRIHWNSVDINKFKEYPEDLINNSKFKKEFFNEFNIDSNKPTILFVGNIVKAKNINLLIEAKKLIKTDCNLLIVGEGPLLNDLKDKVTKDIKNNNINNVYFTGPRRDVEKIIPTTDLLVLPSQTESFGLVLLEALACGKPVIGTNIGGIKEIIREDVGLLVNPNDKEDLANAIDKILTNNDLRDKFKSNARNRAKEFSKVNIPYDEID